MTRTIAGRLKAHWERNGIAATIRRCGREVLKRVRLFPAIRRRPRFDSLAQLLDFSYGDAMTPIQPSQVRSELAGLLAMVAALRPRTVLEIGTNNGGTLFLWPRASAPDAMILSLDLPGGEFGGGYWKWRRPVYRAFALPGQSIHLLQADSHAPASLAAVRALLGDRPIDFLLIDGDHTYEGVRADHEIYGPLVRPGGLIAFHDIADHVDQTCQVRKYWLEVRAGREVREFVTEPAAGWAGIGVLIQEPLPDRAARA